MHIPDDLLYTKDDEWVRVDGEEITVGITDYAQDQLNDIVYLELPTEGEAFEAGDTFGVVESVKAAADLYMPVPAVITAANEPLMDTPEDINTDPYAGGWLVKATLAEGADLSELMSPEAYAAYCEERG